MENIHKRQTTYCETPKKQEIKTKYQPRVNPQHHQQKHKKRQHTNPVQPEVRVFHIHHMHTSDSTDSYYTVHGKEMRYYSMKRIDMELFEISKTDIDLVTILDDHFLSDYERAMQILDLMIGYGITPFFPNSLSLQCMDERLIERLKIAGVDQLILAVESGSQRILSEIMHKPLTLEKTSEVVNLCRKHDIYTDANILVGLPFETEQDWRDSRNYLVDLGCNWYRINTATPLAGSEFYKICKYNNLFEVSEELMNFKRAVVNNGVSSSKKIQEYAYELNLYLNFKHNYDMRIGRFDLALKGLLNTLKAKPDHKLALHCIQLIDSHPYSKYLKREE